MQNGIGAFPDSGMSGFGLRHVTHSIVLKGFNARNEESKDMTTEVVYKVIAKPLCTYGNICSFFHFLEGPRDLSAAIVVDSLPTPEISTVTPIWILKLGIQGRSFDIPVAGPGHFIFTLRASLTCSLLRG
jgi:hypothetical protein